MKVMVIGTGTMGRGITQLLMCCDAVSELFVYSRDGLKLETLKTHCIYNLERIVTKGKLKSSNVISGVNKLQLGTDLSLVASVDIVIEAITESYSAKFSLIDSLSQYLNENVIFASNTSSLSITALASRLPYPENAIGLHFFNPAPIMELVEVVKGLTTSDQVVKAAVQFASKVSKTPVIVNEGPGFVVNRMLIPMINEAICILAEGVATKEDIDISMVCGAHHPMGPLKLSDLIGNDVVLSIMDVLFTETGDSKYRATPLLRKMVRANKLGRKTQLGFYSY